MNDAVISMLKRVLNCLRPAEELAQVNTGRRETYAERRARNLGKTRNNFIREPEASLGDIKLHSVGELCLTCRKCDARLFKGERTAPGNTFSFCCAQGQVQIPRIPRPPSPLDDYLTEQTPAAKHFRGNTRQFNNALSMASTGAKVSDRIASGVQSFTVCGKVHHRMGPLLPEQGARPAFAQLYILDPDAANSRRLEIFPDLSREVLDKLDQMLRQHNGFVSIFERAVQTSNQENKPELKLVLNADMTTVPDPRRYNVPASNGLAAFIPDGMLPEVNCRQIALNVRGGGMKYIDDLHHDYDPLYFVLLFPRGEAGWSPYIPLRPKTPKVGGGGDDTTAVVAHEANEDDDEEGDEEEGNQHQDAEEDIALNNDETEEDTTANAGITTSTTRRSKCVSFILNGIWWWWSSFFMYLQYSTTV